MNRDFARSWVEYILEFNLPEVEKEQEIKYNIIFPPP